MRDVEGLQRFKELTTKSARLMTCVKLPVEEAFNKWYKNIDKILHQCFKKTVVYK